MMSSELIFFLACMGVRKPPCGHPGNLEGVLPEKPATRSGHKQNAGYELVESSCALSQFVRAVLKCARASLE